MKNFEFNTKNADSTNIRENEGMDWRQQYIVHIHRCLWAIKTALLPLVVLYHIDISVTST